MSRPRALGAIAGLALLVAAALRAEDPRPNIVLIIADDLGWTDLGCYGSPVHPTPCIDRLAAQGVRFTQAYAAGSVCSPTRASLLTGKHPVRTGVTDWIPGLNPPGKRLRAEPTATHLDLDEITFAERLRDAGYESFYAGKWHLGDEGFGPAEQGFDHVIPDASQISDPEGREDVASRERLMRSSRTYVDEALAFVGARDRSRPFMVTVSFNDVHAPIRPHEEFIDAGRRAVERIEGPTPERAEGEGRTRLRQDDAAYASMVIAMDAAVGRLLDGLEQLGLADGTAVIFVSDNGGLTTRRQAGPTSVLPLRAGKGWLFEGGIRVPLILRLPARAVAGVVDDRLVVSMDLFATILDLAGIDDPQAGTDGASLLPESSDGSAGGGRTLFWHYPHYHASQWTPGGAIRAGSWKLLEFFETGRVELYDLESDPGEQRNLAAMEPGRVKVLRAELAGWRQQVGARLPARNPGASP